MKILCNFRLIETWDVLKRPCTEKQIEIKRGLIETWDVLKPPCRDILGTAQGLIETWDVLKLLRKIPSMKAAIGLIETWDVLKLLYRLKSPCLPSD